MQGREPTMTYDRTATAPTDWETRYRALVLRELAFDFRVGFFLAYYRSFATPLTAGALVASGEILRNPGKRSYDTAIIVMEIITGGFDSNRGQAAIALLNRAHQHISAPREEYLYILLALFIEPLRWSQRHGRRPLTDTEQAAALRFYQELGARMHLTDIPASVDAATAFYDRFQADHVRPNPDSPALFDATVHVLTDRLPRPLRPLTRPILAVLIDDPAMAATLGLRPPHPAFRRLVHTTVLLHARRDRPQREDAFTPGRSASQQYPNGYTLQDLGPAHLR